MDSSGASRTTTFRVGLLTNGEPGEFLEAVAEIVACAAENAFKFELLCSPNALDRGSQALLRVAPQALTVSFLRETPASYLGFLFAQFASEPGDAICIVLHSRTVVPSSTFACVARTFRERDTLALTYVEKIITTVGERYLPADPRVLLDALVGLVPPSAFFIGAGALARCAGLDRCATFEGCLTKLAEAQIRASRLDRTQLCVHGNLPWEAKGVAGSRGRSRLALEHTWFPRYALIDADVGDVALLSDPRKTPEKLSRDAFLARLTGIVCGQSLHGAVPEYLVFVSQAAWSAIERSRLAAHVLDHIGETLKEHETISILVGASRDGALRVRPALRVAGRPDLADGGIEIGLCAIRTESLIASVLSGRIAHFSKFAELPLEAQPILAVETNLEIYPPREPPAVPAAQHDSPMSALVRMAVRLRSTLPMLSDGVRADFAERKSALTLASSLARTVFGSSFPFAIGGELDRVFEAVFVLPIFSYGGVERVCLRIASLLKRHGFITTLVITKRSEVEGAEEVIQAFDRIVFLKTGPNFPSLWIDDKARDKLIRIGEGADVFVPTHVVDIGSVLERVGAGGAAIVSHLHLLARDPDLRPAGHPYVVSEYQDRFDGVLAISKQLVDWSIAQGFAPSRVLHVPNASAHLFETDVLDQSRRSRADRATDNLKILFIGRLDAEKGLPRLAAFTRHVLARSQRLTLRIVGSGVIEDGASLPQDLLSLVQPSSFDPTVIAAHYAWADVLFVPSLNEGIPLTILEASLFGVVPVATRVGAIEEVISDGEDGFLVDPEDNIDVTDALTSAVEILASDRALLRSMSDRRLKAAAPGEHWEKVTADVAHFFQNLIASKGETLARARYDNL